MPAFQAPTAYYAAPVSDFLADTAESIVGALTIRSGSVDASQRDAWLGQIAVLKAALGECNGTVFLEFDVPRIGSRIDAVLVAGPAVVVIEFKVGEHEFRIADRNQVWDYALDLKNFHQASHAAPIVPILVATEAADAVPHLLDPADDGVFPPMMCNASRLGQAIRLALSRTSGAHLDALAWAAHRITRHRRLSKRRRRSTHITRSTLSRAMTPARESRRDLRARRGDHRGRQTARPKSHRVRDWRARRRQDAGGLERRHPQTRRRSDARGVLSGNGPLVKVLSEALARDEVARRTAHRDTTRKGVIQQGIKAFIQNVHHFRDAGLKDDGPPPDRVVIFDEAQRAWNREMTSDFMRRKKGRPGFTESEPEFLLSYLDRHDDWAVVICLVGGGQEINRGEAGISAWLDAVSTTFTDWTAYISPNLTDSEYDAGHALQTLGTKANVVEDESLHLSVSMRSFRAEHVSRFVKAVLDREVAEARDLLGQFSPRYPIAFERPQPAKAWIRQRARGSERFGLVASSGAQRLKPHAVDVRVEVDPVHLVPERSRRHALELLLGRRRHGVPGAGSRARLGRA